MNSRAVRSSTPVLLCSLATTALEIAMLLILPDWHWIAGHIVICLACAVCARAIAIRYADSSRPMLLVLFTAVLGPLGSFATAVVLLLTIWHSRKATPFDEWYRALFPQLEQNQEVALWEQLLREQEEGDHLDVPAFHDVLTFGTAAQKQALLALVNRRFRAEFGPILKRALRDGENAIRVQAATAISRLESEFLQKSVRLTKAIEAAPQDGALTLEMARLCDNFAFAGILDSKRQADTREAALRYYRRYLELNPEDGAVMLTVARQELRNARFREAVTLLDRAGEDGWSDSAILWRIECMHGLGRTSDARALALQHRERLESSRSLSNEAVDAVRLWSQGAEA